MSMRESIIDLAYSHPVDELDVVLSVYVIPMVEAGIGKKGTSELGHLAMPINYLA